MESTFIPFWSVDHGDTPSLPETHPRNPNDQHISRGRAIGIDLHPFLERGPLAILVETRPEFATPTFRGQYPGPNSMHPRFGVSTGFLHVPAAVTRTAPSDIEHARVRIAPRRLEQQRRHSRL